LVALSPPAVGRRRQGLVAWLRRKKVRRAAYGLAVVLAPWACATLATPALKDLCALLVVWLRQLGTL
jgi:hypothetical protein